MLTAINFHYIREQYPEAYYGIHGVVPVEFENQLDQTFKYLFGDDIDTIINGKSNLPENSMIITFDYRLRE